MFPSSIIFPLYTMTITQNVNFTTFITVFFSYSFTFFRIKTIKLHLLMLQLQKHHEIKTKKKNALKKTPLQFCSTIFFITFYRFQFLLCIYSRYKLHSLHFVSVFLIINNKHIIKIKTNYFSSKNTDVCTYEVYTMCLVLCMHCIALLFSLWHLHIACNFVRFCRIFSILQVLLHWWFLLLLFVRHLNQTTVKQRENKKLNFIVHTIYTITLIWFFLFLYYLT